MFSEEIKKCSKKPRNFKDLEICNEKGFTKDSYCSDCFSVRFNVKKGIIENVKLQVCNCPEAICTADVFIDLIKDLSIEEAFRVNESDVEKSLGAFSEECLGYIRLLVLVFRKVLKDYCPKVIGITGGKGGTGKSTVATALAYKLSKNSKVLLVDADVDCPNDHLLLSIERKTYKKVKQRIPVWDFEKCTKCGVCGKACKTNSIIAIKGKNPIFIPSQCNGCGACVLKCPEKAISWGEKVIGEVFIGENYNVELLSGELKSNEPISEFIVNSLNEIIEEKKYDYDYVIIDTAAGTHCPVIAALKMCDMVFSVTEPTPLGGHDLELILKLLKKMKIKNNIVLNRSDTGDKKIIESLAKKHQIEIVAKIPYEKDIVSQYTKGRPITDKNIDIIADIINSD